MIAFIDDHRGAHGVEPICKVLPIAPSTYHAHVAKRRDPARLSARARQDVALKIEVRRVFDQNFRVYGARKVWRQLKREGFDVARCTVSRLMRDMGLQGVIRGKPVKTTISDKAAPCPLDHVNRQFKAPRPNVLWLSDFTYVATWTGFVYVAFVIDAYARRIVGWRASRTAHAGFVLDALEQALHDRRPVHRSGLVHHSDRGSQGGFKRSSQHQLLSLITEDRQAPPPAVFQPSVFRGRALRAAATADISSALWMLRSVPFGKYCRSNPLVFSLVPRCHGLCGSQK
ncbi:putative transposase [Bradyrhizobium sp. LB1.3]